MPIRRSYAIWFLVLVVVLFVGVQIGLPRFAAAVIQTQLANRTKAGLITVSVEAFPFWKLLGGYVDSLHLDMRNARFGDLPTSGFLVDANGIQVDMKRLLGERREFRVTKAASLRATLRLTETNLNDYLWRVVDKDKTFRVTLANDKASFRGHFSVIGVPINVNLGGKFALIGPTTLRFVPDEFFLAQQRLPKAFLDRFLAEAFTFPLPVKGLPVDVRITDLRVEKGRLYLFASQAGSVKE